MTSKINALIIAAFFFISLAVSAQVTFRSVTSLNAPSTPYELAKGDFNNDGKLDLVSVNFNGLANQQVSLMLNTGSGTFTGANFKNFASATNPLDVAVGDFNKDGNLDVVTCSQTNDNFSLLLGNGAGNLASPINFAAGDLPQGIAVGDMNKDGNLDVLMTHRGTPDDVYLFLGNGASGFSVPIIIPITMNTGWDITVADFNGDTNLDFAISTAGVYTLQIWNGNGLATPSFNLVQTVTGFGITPDLDARDLDGDGDMDLLAGAAYSLNNGTGVFGTRILLLQTDEEYAVGDLNKDGKPDIAATDNVSNQAHIRVFLGDGLGAFTLLAKFETVLYARGLEILDVNNDGNMDVVGAGVFGGNGKVGVHLGDGTGYFPEAPTKYPSLTDPRDLVKGDFNEDGQIDIALCHSIGSIATIYLGQGNGRFAKTATNYTTGGFPTQIITIDYNKDNHLDLVTYNQISSSVTVLTGAGNGSFSLLANFSVTSTAAGRMTTADFNSDTNPDLVVSGYTSKVINYLSGTGSGFNTAVTIPTSADVIEIKAADFNGDGKVDIVADLSNISKFVLFLGNGTGGFNESATQYAHRGSFFLIEDMNNDSKPDVIAFEIGSSNDFFINDGAGNFTGSGIATSLGGFPWGYADMNGDGFKDLILGAQNPISSNTGQVLIYKGTATGITNSVHIQKLNSGGNRLVIEDVNADGKPDVIATSFSTSEDYLGVLINTSGPPPCTPPVITFVTPSTTGCLGQPIQFFVSATGATPFTYQWKKNSVVLTGETLSSIELINPSSADAGIYTCTITNGCGTATSADITLTFIAKPTTPTVTGAGSCAAASITLTASGGTNGNYRWYTDGFDPDGDPIIEIIPAAVNNTYTTPILTKTTTYYVTTANGSCESNPAIAVATIGGSACNNKPPVINTMSVSVVANGIVTINLLPLISDVDNNVDLNSLKIKVPPTSEASASIANGVLTINYTGIDFLGTDIVTIEVCDVLGSCTEQSLTIEVTGDSGDITIYNGISPNGDQLNATWQIKNIEVLSETKKNKVTLYNRWGDEVFSMANYDNKNKVFKGLTNSGSELPSGTYFYKIEFESGRNAKTGYLILKK
jgi:gliding motility-associated-like protein